MALWQNVAGIMNDLFGIGGPAGVKLKNNSGTLQVRNAGDTGLAPIQMSSARIASGAVNGHVAVSNANGDVTWTAPSAFLGGTNAVLTQEETFTQATSSPLTLFTPPANARLDEVGVSVTTAASGGTPTLSVGVSGQAALYMATSENSLLAVNEYVKELWVDAGASPAAVIVTITPSGQTFSGRVWMKYTIPA